MNKQTKTILYIALFAVFMVAVVFAYQYLADRYQAQSPLDPKPSFESTPGTTPKNSQESPPESTDSQSENEEEKMKAPDFTVYDYDGNEVKLSSYEGTAVVLNFWASWCPPCKAEMPYFNKVSEEYQRDELMFLMVDLVDGQRETIEKGKKFIEENNYTFTVLFDTKQDAAVTYGIRSIPSTLFIDTEGYIQAGIEGSIEEDMLRQGIKLIHP